MLSRAFEGYFWNYQSQVRLSSIGRIVAGSVAGARILSSGRSLMRSRNKCMSSSSRLKLLASIYRVISSMPPGLVTSICQRLISSKRAITCSPWCGYTPAGAGSSVNIRQIACRKTDKRIGFIERSNDDFADFTVF